MFRIILLVCLIGFVGCTRVDPGHVGIKVNLYGDQKGVDEFPLKTGRVWYNPFTEELYEYPVFMQNKSWVGDESITFNSIEGSSISVDVGLNYTLDQDRVPHMFIEFRQDIETITHGYLRNQVRDAFGRVGGKYKAIEIFGENKQKLLEEVKLDLDTKLRPKGFMIDTVSFISAPKADERVMQSINSVIEANQKAIEAENKVRQIEAEAKQEIARAEGKSQSILMEAKAQAESNKLLSESLTPELIQYTMFEKWNGTAPQVLGESTMMMLNMDKGK